MISDQVHEVWGLDALRFNFSSPRLWRTRISASANFRDYTEEVKYSEKEHRMWGWVACIWNTALPCSSCVNLPAPESQP